MIRLINFLRYRFAPLFKDIENEIHSQGTLGIDSYGTSMPTLEEVFLRLGDEETEEEGGAPKVIQQVQFCITIFSLHDIWYAIIILTGGWKT